MPDGWVLNGIYAGLNGGKNQPAKRIEYKKQMMKGEKMSPYKTVIAILLSALFWSTYAPADDSEISRSTLTGLKGVYVLVENIQPNIQKYAQKAGLSTEQIKKNIEKKLFAAGIRTLSRDEWLKLAGRPVLYVNINTHETEKYWYAYDIKCEFRQIVSLEVNPKVKTLANTWSVNITGMTNIGNLHLIKKDADVLLERFIQAHRSVNRRK
ncbi:MAG: hypothetical protein CVU71_16190 [Deltaproteobacteria bacterium HGW-Deltaproteobacteria-6]|jgi:hypothetical protein|nr:MAG: hypothetical protein CVU71_16190 [Deltaproteobacteria bacterium HGW-Deltaproteobacteria-6]